MIPIIRPSIRRKDMDSVLTCMVNDNLGPGDRSSELISTVSHHLGVAGGIALRERGRALSLALEMLNPRPGSGVAMDPLLPAHYHDIVVDAGLVPIYVDVGDEGACIDPQKLELLVAESRKVEETDGSNGQAPDASSADTLSVDTISADTPGVGTLGVDSLGVILTHTSLGYVPDMEVIAGFGVPVIEDISQGIGANTGDRLVGSYGRLTILGMEADGIITAGGGTLLLAASKADAARLRRIADGLPSDALLPDMNAALGLTQINELERFISRRAELATLFARAVMRGRHTVPGQPGDGENIHFTFPVMVTAGTADVRQYARKKGVDTSMAFDGSVLAQQGRSADARNTDDPSVGSAAPGSAMISESDFPAARALGLRCVRFPLYPALTGEEAAIIERVLSTLP